MLSTNVDLTENRTFSTNHSARIVEIDRDIMREAKSISGHDTMTNDLYDKLVGRRGGGRGGRRRGGLGGRGGGGGGWMFSKKKEGQSAFVMFVDEKHGYLGNAVAVTATVVIKPQIIASLGMYITQNCQWQETTPMKSLI